MSASESMKACKKLATSLQIKYPIVQAPMAGVSTPSLAAAISNSGGLGSIAIGSSTPNMARKMIQETKKLTSRPFGVNVFCHRPATYDPAINDAWLSALKPFFAEMGAEPPKTLSEIYPTFNEISSSEILEILLSERPSVVSFHFGVPSKDILENMRAANIYTMATATCLEEAQLIEKIGIQAIVAQGYEAGGHRGVFDPDKEDPAIGTLALVRLLKTFAKVPVIAAGGIMDGAGISAAMRLGASGVQLGTAFILCPESSASQPYRDLLKSKRSKTTGITKYISGRPARGIINRAHVIRTSGDALMRVPDYPIAYDAGKALHEIFAKNGIHEFAAHWAGQGAPLAREMPATELFKTLIAEWKEMESHDFDL